MNSKNKLQEIKSSDEKVVNKKLLKDLYKNEKRLQCKIDNRDKRIKTLKEEMKTLKVENKSLKLENENLEYTISHLNKLLDESHNEIALLKIDARLDNDNAANKIKDYESLKKNLKKELELSNERIEELYTELLNDIGDVDLNFSLLTCPHCGAVVGEDSNYCVECGSKL